MSDKIPSRAQAALIFEEPGPERGQLERWCLLHGQSRIIGVDEAGRGPLAGPVYAAAVALDLAGLDEDWLALIGDSKALSAARREQAYDAITARALGYSIQACTPEVIDAVNILQATRLAMKRAVEEVARHLGAVQCVYIDGREPIDIAWPQRCLVKGDARSLNIGAASILAKVARDRYMDEADAMWPEYGFRAHKGYPTKSHRDAVAKHGPCPEHRLSFGGVREHVERLRAPRT